MHRFNKLLYIHVKDTATAKETWDKLQVAFEDSGLTRKVSLLRTLVTTQLDKCKSVEEYVGRIVTTAHTLNNLNFKVPDEWISTLLLAGLPDDYRPMIMGLENSGSAITTDFVKTKLLQDIKYTQSPDTSNSEMAFYTKRKGRGPRCYTCNKYGHIATQCRFKQAKQSPPSDKTDKQNKSITSKKEKAFISY